MNNIEELFIANAELAAELLQHMADNEIDSDYFAVVTDSPNCGREVQSEHSVTEVALMAAGIIEQLITQLEAAQKELSAANEKLSKP
ncbi:TPA: ead/Ea22-like family protein, partial [Yersinia enterocolitica]